MVIETLKYVNANILKMAPTAKIALKIGGLTIHSAMKLKFGKSSLFEKITSDIEKLDPSHSDYIKKSLDISKEFYKCINCSRNPHIVVIDEIGMLPFYLTYQIIQYFFSFGVPKLFILMGDEHQLKPVKCQFNIFNTKILEYKKLYLEDNHRFTANYNSVIKFLKNLMDEGNIECFITYINNTYPILNDIYESTLKQCHHVLVHTNEAVEKYNNFYIENLPGPTIIIPKIEDGVVCMQNSIILKKNCEIFVTQNCIVPNGNILTFISHDLEKDVLVCEDSNSSVDIRRGKLGQFPVSVGFASTIHKFQGETINGSLLIDFDGNTTEMNLIYTALSRVRSMDQIVGIKW